jgi:hypothetical protein
MANLLGKLSRLMKEEGHLKNIEFVMDCPRHHIPLLDRQKTRQLLLEASMLFPGTYAATAAFLEQPDPPPTAD